jgi:hypothetical protein
VTWPPIVELRQYRLKPGRRDDLVDVFEEHFVESQEEEGMSVIGTFRNLDDEAKFVWLRGFSSMPERRRGLEAFYGGPVWKANRERANDTMIDSDNVLLLRPARNGLGLPAAGTRLPVGAAAVDRGIVEIVVLLLDTPADDETIELVASCLDGSTGKLLGLLVTEDAENDFPSLPVREGEHALVCVIGHPDRARPGGGQLRAAASRLPNLIGIEELRLAPTARSLLAGDRSG